MSGANVRVRPLPVVGSVASASTVSSDGVVAASKGRCGMPSRRQLELIHGLLPAHSGAPPVSWRDRRRARGVARGVEQDRDVRARLDAARVVIATAAGVVAQGWIQHAWYQVRDDTDAVRTVTARDLGLLECGPVVAACLVGAVVHAAGGRYAAHDQVTGDSIDLVWTAAFAGGDRSGVSFSPPPSVRALRVLDLTRWNDRPGRCLAEVLELLDTADDRAIAEAVQDRR